MLNGFKFIGLIFMLLGFIIAFITLVIIGIQTLGVDKFLSGLMLVFFAIGCLFYLIGFLIDLLDKIKNR